MALPDPPPVTAPTVLVAALVGAGASIVGWRSDARDLELDIDLGATDGRRLATVLGGLGFVRAADGAERWLVGYDEDGDRWLRLRLVGPRPGGVVQPPLEEAADEPPLEVVVPRRLRDGRTERLEPLEAAAVAEAAVAKAVARPRLRGRHGLTVALLGPDGTGKSTLATAIAARFPFPATIVYMGLWKRPASRPLVPGLDLARRLAFAWRRYLLGWYHRRRGRLVVFDRYAYDALAGLPEAHGLVTRVYLTVLGRSCPAPDLAILLDSTAEVAFARKGELGVDQLERDRRRFRALASRVPGVEVVDADRPFDVVQADAIRLIWRRYRSRDRG